MKCHVCGDSSRLEPVTCVRRCETTHVTARPSRSRSPDSPTGRPDLTPPADLPGLPSFSVSDGRGPADTRPMRPEFTPTPHRRPPLRGGLSPDTARLAGAVQLPSGYLLPAGTFTLSSLSFWSRDVGLHTLWLPGRRRAPSRSRDPGRGAQRRPPVCAPFCAWSPSDRASALLSKLPPTWRCLLAELAVCVLGSAPPWAALAASRLLTVRASGPRLLRAAYPCCR